MRKYAKFDRWYSVLCVIVAGVLHVRYGDMGELGMFVVTAMTALGT